MSLEGPAHVMETRASASALKALELDETLTFSLKECVGAFPGVARERALTSACRD